MRALHRAADRISPPGYGRSRSTATISARGRDRPRRLGPAPLPAPAGEPLTIAWVCVPPGEGSGGHTTMFRMVAALEQAGHRCVIYLHDRHGWSIDQHARRSGAGGPSCRPRSATADGIEDAHAIFATVLGDRYPVLASPARGARFYLVQDFEPSFYPAGSEALLPRRPTASASTASPPAAGSLDALASDYGMPADHFDFGCDLDRYRSTSRGRAHRRLLLLPPATPRRAFELAVVALDLFAERHPEVEIHLFGEPGGSLPFAATDHGLLTPEQLTTLYNRCVAGLTLSATNVSLVPHEMLAAGCIPVVNDAEHNRIVLDNPARRLRAGDAVRARRRAVDLVERHAAARAAPAARAAAASVQRRSWRVAGDQVEAIVRAWSTAGRPAAWRRDARTTRVAPHRRRRSVARRVTVPPTATGRSRRLIRTVLDQEGVDVRIRIVDDCSPDDSPPWRHAGRARRADRVPPNPSTRA